MKYLTMYVISQRSDYFYYYYFPVLTAINEDSPTVPTLLTDYILKGQSGKLKFLLQYWIILSHVFITIYILYTAVEYYNV